VDDSEAEKVVMSFSGMRSPNPTRRVGTLRCSRSMKPCESGRPSPSGALRNQGLAREAPRIRSVILWDSIATALRKSFYLNQ
jgi:hypothetical protein